MSNDERDRHIVRLLDEWTKAKQDVALLGESLRAAAERFAQVSTALRQLDRTARDPGHQRYQAQTALQALLGAGGDFTAVRRDLDDYIRAAETIDRTAKALKDAGVPLD
jgi:hypothetical protein